jgi:hypothetical protein
VLENVEHRYDIENVRPIWEGVGGALPSIVLSIARNANCPLVEVDARRLYVRAVVPEHIQKRSFIAPNVEERSARRSCFEDFCERSRRDRHACPRRAGVALGTGDRLW